MLDLTTQLQLIEDRNAIADLEAGYAAHWDFGRLRGWAEVFTPGGVFEMPPAGSLQPFKAVCETILEGDAFHASPSPYPAARAGYVW